METLLSEVGEDLKGADNPGLVIAARVRRYVDENASGQVDYCLPPRHRDADFELHEWLEKTCEVVLASERQEQVVASIGSGVNLSLLEDSLDAVMFSDDYSRIVQDESDAPITYRAGSRENQADHEL